MKKFLSILFTLSIIVSSCTKTENENYDADTSNKFIRISPNFDAAPLTSFAFTDENTGSITTASKIILNTLDGGAEWKNATIYGSTYLENLYFYNADLGFCSDPNFKTFKYKAANWTTIDFPINNTYISCFQMLQENLLYATTVMGKNDTAFLMLSKNAGQSWIPLYETKTDLKKVLMLNNETGFLISNAHKTVEILKSTDAGSNWTNTLQEDFGLNYSGTLQLKDIISIDADHLIAIGRGSDSNQGLVLSSTDGGSTWNSIQIPQSINCIYKTTTDIYFGGSSLFVARWKINLDKLTNPKNITDDWFEFDKDNDFFLTEEGKPLTHYPDVTQIQFTDNKTGFILTSGESYLFKIKL